MPRTNARVWPKAHSAESSPCSSRHPINHQPPPIARDQYMVVGAANPPPVQPYYQPVTGSQYHADMYQQSQVPSHNQSIPPPWVPIHSHQHMSSWNHGQPIPASSIVDEGTVQWNETVNTHRQKQPTAGSTIYPESHKQELWVDGPTEFTRNLQVLTSKLRKEETTHHGRRASKQT